MAQHATNVSPLPTAAPEAVRQPKGYIALARAHPFQGPHVVAERRRKEAREAEIAAARAATPDITRSPAMLAAVLLFGVLAEDQRAEFKRSLRAMAWFAKPGSIETQLAVLFAATGRPEGMAE